MKHLFLILSFAFFTISFLGGQQFVDVTKAMGIEHNHVAGSMLGGGAVFFDFDNDGWQDIFMTGGETSDKLYRNIEGKRFEDVSLIALPFIKGSNISTGVVSLDFDNNGCRDLFITTLNATFPSVLLRNNCDGTFTNVSTPFGIVENAVSMNANILDVNQDGWQDIYVINYVTEEIFIRDDDDIVIGFEHECSRNFLYLNNGQGQFVESGEIGFASGNGCGLAVSSLNFLEDGTKGFYVANDFGEWVEPNELFVWNDNTQSAVDYGLDIGLYGMGIGVGDIDNDMDFDLYVTNIGKNALMINSNNYFQDEAAQWNVENEFVRDSVFSVSWGTFFADLDNDRDQDLFVSNGFVPSAPFLTSSELNSNNMFENQSGTMVDVVEEWGLTNFGINRGAIYGDYNNDGFLDILVANLTGADIGTSENVTFKLYENSGNENNYLKLYFQGETDYDSYGTIVTLHAGGEPRKQILLSSATHASQHENTLVFGLAQLNTIDSINVVWPDGLKQNFTDLNVNTTYQLDQSSNTAAVIGCMDVNAANYNPEATINLGCVSKTTTVVNPIADIEIDIFSYDGQLYFMNHPSNRSVDIQVYNVIGQQLIGIQNHDYSPIDLGSLSSGIYTAVVNFGGALFSKKFAVINE